jgi:hypothetical protein
MCLIVHQPEGLNLSDELLMDIYQSNRDGLGIMYATGGKLRIKKFLPKSAEEFAAIYNATAAGRECLIHARMTTHGATDLENCHPYVVTGRVALMHNGVLSMGNSWDKEKSDTWHFVRNIVAPAIAHNPELLHDENWQKYMGAIIGSSNRVAMMDNRGRAVIINRATGVEFMGAWFSNTYAWPATQYGCKVPDYYSTGTWKNKYSGYGYRYSSSGKYWGTDYDGGDDYTPATAAGDSSGAIVATSTATARTLPRYGRGSLSTIWRAARNSYVRDRVVQWIHDAPERAERLITAICNASDYDTESTERYTGWVYTNPIDAAYIIEKWFETDGSCPPDPGATDAGESLAAG